MKKGLMLAIVIMTSAVITINSTPWNWLSQGVNENNLLLNLALESLIQQVDGIPFKDPVKFNTYKLKLSEIQKKIKSESALLAKNPNAAAVKKMQEMGAQLAIEENKILAEAQKDMDPVDFVRLKTAVDNRMSLIKKELTLANVADKLNDIWKKYAIPSFKAKILENNPIANSQAQVKHDAKLSYYEDLYRSRRMPLVRSGLNKFFNGQVERPLTIGFVASGGGYRAMISTVGYLSGMEYLGLLDAATYVAGLSGSTWCLVPWISMGSSIREFKEKLIEKIRNNMFDIKNVQSILKSDIKSLVNDIIWPKFLFDQPIGSIDLYGALLAKTLLADFGENRHKQHLSNQWSMIQDGSKPFPLYAAISMHKAEDSSYLYNWYEFNPVEVRNLEVDLSIPAHSFNSIFNAGIAKEVAPEQSLGFLMGIFGSAYAVNIKDIDTKFFSAIQAEEKNQSSFEKVKYIATTEIVGVMGGSSLGTLRASPAQINNPFRGITQYAIPDWLKNREFITFVDAGIDYNLPVRSLLRPARRVDLIIIADASGNAAEAKELTKVFDDAKRFHRYNYVRVDDRKNKTLHFYKDLNNKNAPRIIYINFIKDEQLMQQAQKNSELKKLIDTYDLTSFDVVACMEKGSCGTFNFNYSEKDFLQLSGMAQFNVMANEEDIKQFIKKEFFTPEHEEFEFEF